VTKSCGHWDHRARSPEIKERASQEMADIFIYLLSMSHDLVIDLIEAATKKLEESQARYPVEKSRGSSKIYTELT
jgi:NTP pyrophosphatase (non-canonical NTP hydrolase)